MSRPIFPQKFRYRKAAVPECQSAHRITAVAPARQNDFLMQDRRTPSDTADYWLLAPRHDIPNPLATAAAASASAKAWRWGDEAMLREECASARNSARASYSTFFVGSSSAASNCKPRSGCSASRYRTHTCTLLPNRCHPEHCFVLS